MKKPTPDGALKLINELAKCPGQLVESVSLENNTYIVKLFKAQAIPNLTKWQGVPIIWTTNSSN